MFVAIIIYVIGSWAKADSASFVPEFERFAMAGDKSGEDLPEMRNWKLGVHNPGPQPLRL